ncbi:MAG: imidazole glycerol phosphate synthase subunit HisH [Gammaproteobacteria bacterium]|nr:imidazole glycerol phosphate synthase subunit HisH [Gammaproteobacteria bacterium]
MSLVIVDSGGANIASLRHAFERLGVDSELTAEPERIRAARRVILPGVGAAGEGMRRLRERNLVDCVRGLKQPVLGICLGMQLLFEGSEEGAVDGLGILPGRVARLEPKPGLRVPHMGWNTLDILADSPLLAGIGVEDYFYFVHSYAAPVNGACVASAEHGRRFAACVQKDNFFGAQFHPERSGPAGARLLANFLKVEA